MTTLWETLLRGALEKLADTVENPPPLRLGKYLLTKVDQFHATRVTGTRHSIIAEAPGPNCEPMGVVWREVD